MHRHQSLQPYTTYRVRETRERPHSDLVTHQDQFASDFRLYSTTQQSKGREFNGSVCVRAGTFKPHTVSYTYTMEI